LAVFCDGIWRGFPDKNARSDGLSYDGTTEILKQYKFVSVLACGWWGEKKATNRAMHEIAKHGIEYAIQLSSDEWIDGDRDRFLANLIETIEDEQKPMYLAKNVTHHVSPASQEAHILPRIHWYPALNTLRYVHWWWFFMNKPVNFGSIIRGITFHHDDRPRDPKREKLMNLFQKYQAKTEREAMNHVQRKTPKPIIYKHPCGCQDGVEFYWARGGILGRDVRIKCSQHTMMLKG